MANSNVVKPLLVLFYACIELLSMLILFLWFAKYQVKKEIFAFTFESSTFDLVLLAVLRFTPLLVSCTLIGCNQFLPIKQCSGVSLCFGCLQAIYIIIKIIIYTEKSASMQKRFWMMVMVTLLSSVMSNSCWRILQIYQGKTLLKNGNSDGHKYKIVENSITDGEIRDDTNKNDDYSTTGIILNLVKMAKPDVALILLMGVSIVSSAFIEAFMPYFAGIVVNHTVIDKSLKSVKEFHWSIVYMALLALAAAFTSAVRYGLSVFVWGRYKLRLQNVLFSNIMQMEIAFFDENKTGELTSRITTDCTLIGEIIGGKLTSVIYSAVALIGTLYFMMVLSWELCVVILITIPVLSVLSVYFSMKYKDTSSEVQHQLAKANALAAESILSIRTVRSHGKESNEASKYSCLLEDCVRSIRKQGIISALCMGTNVTTGNVMIGLVLFYGGRLVMEGNLSVGQLLSCIIYSFKIAKYFRIIGKGYIYLMGMVGISTKVFSYINRESLEINGNFIPTNREICGRVEFRNVSFSYPLSGDVAVLKNVNFTAERGEMVALVGHSGCGKTSVASLLQHFYEPTQGDVIIDGVAMKNYDHTFLREKMSSVQQEPDLFSRSISENITYGLNVDVTQEEIECASKSANAHMFITKMTNKYETRPGRVQLSGGEKQRIAIARSLVCKPTILILDEATSQLDTESELMVQEAIRATGRTVLIIAHRLSTIEKADKILVMKRGEIVEQGTHEELLARQSVYASLVNKGFLGP